MTAEASKRRLPACWGHRGASASFPENTLASFEAAIRDGAEGIESDVHVSADDVVLMFHDPALGRTTDGAGNIRERKWYGADGMEQHRTIKEPHQPIPTFAQTVDLLMKPENRHVEFNVDVKIWNDGDRLFKLMKTIIEAQPEWETQLAPRIVLGLWHPRFIAPATKHLPYCRRAHIGLSPWIARQYFWESCEGFSMAFSALCTYEGLRFIRDCQLAQPPKRVMVWTVNAPEQMVEAARWGVDVVLTDVTRKWLDLRASLAEDFDKTAARVGSRTFLWTTWTCYSPVQYVFWHLHRRRLESIAGPLEKAILDKTNPLPIVVSSSGA
ncbi:PLC-like phosphodiesterase [Exidia glandulosa HHB12029]|uniref:PLC-like phosphodiesterase n=1 Tax=Exidia glandulosa HHB12029 TaxID=1314781 RepID=A0A165QWF2_EXIGL|nr:PLC-like phosphodiesterase [Exidia glandulosa HHB12029]